MRKQLETLEAFIPEKVKANLMLKAFGITRIPLLFATGARVQNINDHSCKICIPFIRKVKNHLGSLYFGALAIGADACIGFLAAHKIYNSGERISLVFKSFEAKFFKRAEGPTLFICEEGESIDQMIEETLASGERVSRKINARAEVRNEVVAQFVLELSLKKKS